MNTPGDSATRDTVRSLDQLERVTEFGPFVQSALELSPQTTIVAGLRYDWVKFAVHDRLIAGTNPDDSGERLMRALSSSLGIAVNPSRSLTVYGNVGSSFETPTTTELANSPSGAGGFNTGLKPQHAWSFELGARGSPDGRFTYSVALFQAEVRDALIPYEIAAPRFFYRNAGSTRHRGVELSSDLSVVPGLSLGAVWTYSDYRFREYSFTDTAGTHVLDGRALSGIPQNWLHVIVRAQPAAVAGAWAEVQQTYSSGYGASRERLGHRNRAVPADQQHRRDSGIAEYCYFARANRGRLLVWCLPAKAQQREWLRYANLEQRAGEHLCNSRARHRSDSRRFVSSERCSTLDSWECRGGAAAEPSRRAGRLEYGPRGSGLGGSANTRCKRPRLDTMPTGIGPRVTGRCRMRF